MLFIPLYHLQWYWKSVSVTPAPDAQVVWISSGLKGRNWWKGLPEAMCTRPTSALHDLSMNKVVDIVYLRVLHVESQTLFFISGFRLTFYL
jgi:hypothetical protein